MSLPEDKAKESNEGSQQSPTRSRPDTEPLAATTTRIELNGQSDPGKALEQSPPPIDPKALISDLLIEESSDVAYAPEALLRTDSNTVPVNRDHLSFLSQADALETIDDLDLEEKFRDQIESLMQKGEETARLDLEALSSDNHDELLNKTVSPTEATGQIDMGLGTAHPSESDSYRTETNRAKRDSGQLVVFNQELINSVDAAEKSEVIFETGEYVRPQLDEDEFADQVPSVGGVFGPYRLLGCLAVGGMAEIFMAVRRDDPELTPLALKRIRKHRTTDDDSIKMFQEEGKICLALSHPNIVNYRDFDVLDGVPYLVMDFIEGMNLQTLSTHCSISSRGIVEVGLSVSQALEYAHALTNEKNEPWKLVHRDVSPQNILIDRRGTVKLVDFGIARFEGRSFHTGVGPRRGKLAYMAPEQLNYEHPVDLRADLFSLGLVLAEMLLGKNLMPNGPLVAGDLTRVIRSSLMEVPDSLPEDLIDIITRMTCFKPEKRPWSAQEVTEVFKAVLPKFDQQQESLPDYGKTIVASKVLPADVTVRNLLQGIRDSKRPEEDTKLNDSLDLEEAEVRALLQEAAKAGESNVPDQHLQTPAAVPPVATPPEEAQPSSSHESLSPQASAAPSQPDKIETLSENENEPVTSVEDIGSDFSPASKPTELSSAPVQNTAPKLESESPSYGIITVLLIVVVLLVAYFLFLPG